MRVVTSRLLLVLLGLSCILSLSLSEENATDDTNTEVTDDDVDGEGGKGSGGDSENADDDGVYINDYILGNPEWYQESYDPVRAF